MRRSFSGRRRLRPPHRHRRRRRSFVSVFLLFFSTFFLLARLLVLGVVLVMPPQPPSPRKRLWLAGNGDTRHFSQQKQNGRKLVTMIEANSAQKYTELRDYTFLSFLINIKYGFGITLDLCFVISWFCFGLVRFSAFVLSVVGAGDASFRVVSCLVLCGFYLLQSTVC